MLARTAFLLAAPLAFLSAPEAEARSERGPGQYGTGFHFYAGDFPYVVYPSFSRPFYFSGYGPRYYKRPYPFRKTRNFTKRSKQCAHWAARCSASWGTNAANYGGCMKHHGCE